MIERECMKSKRFKVNKALFYQDIDLLLRTIGTNPERTYSKIILATTSIDAFRSLVTMRNDDLNTYVYVDNGVAYFDNTYGLTVVVELPPIELLINELQRVRVVVNENGHFHTS
mgnify:CR=1 FL=1